MDLKNFTKEIVRQISEGVDEISSELSREVKVVKAENTRSIEFDVAVTATDTFNTAGKVQGAGQIKVVPFLGGIVKGEGEMEKEIYNSTVTRIRYGVDISVLTKEEEKASFSSINIKSTEFDPYD